MSREIKQAIQQLANDPNKGERVFVCVVESVSLEEKTCDVIIADGSGILLPAVRLQAQPGNGIMVVPKVSSLVVVTMINSTNGHATMFSDVENIVYFDGSFGGLIKIEELVTKINNTENKLNDLIEKWNSFCTSYIPGSPAVTGLPPTLANSVETPLEVTQKSELENTLITHGE